MTTAATLLAEKSVEIVWVLAIEGYSNLITSGSPSKTVTAWSGEPWTAAIPGLSVVGSFSQKWEPFGNDLDVQTIRCTVYPDASDTFGVDVFKSDQTFDAKLTADFTPGDTVITLGNTAGLASSGTVHIGNKSYSYTGTTSTTLTGVTSTLAPLDTDTLSAGQMPGVHTVTTSSYVNSPLRTAPPRVTDSRKDWVGRTVALYIHAVSDGVYDTRANALLKFAGQIVSVYESDNGIVLEMEDYRKKITDTIVMQNRWEAAVEPGYTILEGTFFGAALRTAPTGARVEANSLLECITGATGTAQVEPGRYTADEICTFLSDYVNGDSNLAHATTGAEWAYSVVNTEDGPRVRIHVEPNTATDYAAAGIGSTDHEVIKFLGWERVGYVGFGGTTMGQGMTPTGPITSAWTEFAPAPPKRYVSAIKMTVTNWQLNSSKISMAISKSSGDFLDLTDDIPAQLAPEIAAGEQWSVFSYKKVTFIGRLASATLIDKIRLLPFFGTDGALKELLETEFEGAEAPTVKQVVCITGTLTDVLTKMLASTDGTGVNHATYDDYPFGCAIPWGLLGQSWLDSVADVEQTNATDSIMVVIRRPTSVWDIVKADLMVRSAFFVWKDSGIQLKSFQTPNATSADWTIDTDTVAAAAAGGATRTESQQTQEFLANAIKLFYDKDEADKYRSTIEIRDPESIQNYGLAKPIEIKLPNTYRSIDETGNAVEAVAEMVAARIMPILGRPMRRWRFPVNHQFFEATPGDTVAVTDRWARDPTTGIRGVTLRAATLISIDANYGVSAGPGQMNSTAEVLYTEEERTFPVSPAAEHDETYASGGYTAGLNGTALATKKNKYSGTTDAADASNFIAGDEIQVFEIDPATSATADNFSDTVASVGTSSPWAIQLSSGFGVGGRPAFDANKVYRIIPAKYADADAGQRDTSFLADDADNLIQDLIKPNTYGDERTPSFTALDTTQLPSIHADEYYAEGMPLHTGLIHDSASMMNNLANYKMAYSSPFMLDYTVIGTPGAHIMTIPVPIGSLRPNANRPLTASVGVAFLRQVSGTGELRVESSGEPPRGVTFGATTLRGPVTAVDFTTTSATQWQYPAAQDLQIVRSTLYPGVTFLTFSNPGATVTVLFGGLSKFQIKAAQ